MKIEVQKIEHPRLIHNNDHIVPYMIKDARDKFLEFLDTADCDMPVNTILRYTKEQVKKYKTYKNGSGIPAARPGFSAHEWARSIDFNTNTISNWDSKKKGMEKFGIYGIGSERWHVHYLNGYKSNEEYVNNMTLDMLTIEEMMQVINTFGYGNLTSFQRDFGLNPDGILGPNTSRQIRLLNKEYVFID